MSFHQVHSSVPVLLSIFAAVARAWRPLPLSTSVWPSFANQNSVKYGAMRRLRPWGVTPLSTSCWEYSRTCSSVVGGLFGSSPALAKSILL